MFSFGYRNKYEVLIRDILMIALGVYFLINPGSTVTMILVKVAGALILAFAAIQLFAISGAMSLASGQGCLPSLTSILALFLGGALLFSDFGLVAMALTAGVALIWYGITDILSAWRMGKFSREEAARTAEPDPQPEKKKNDKPVRITNLNDAKEVDFTKE